MSWDILIFIDKIYMLMRRDVAIILRSRVGKPIFAIDYKMCANFVRIISDDDVTLSVLAFMPRHNTGPE